MTWRGIATLAALVSLGVAGGYGLARATRPTPQYVDLAAPAAAASPAVPTTPAVDIKPDSTIPFPGPPFSLRRERVFEPPFTISLPVPDGMVAYVSPSGDSVSWLPPGNPKGSYFIRVTRVTQSRSQSQMVTARAAELPLDSRLQGTLEVVSRTGDSLLVKFVLGGYRQVELLQWASLDGSDTAAVEYAVVGRESDIDGMLSLMGRLVDGTRKVRGRAAS